MKIVKSKLVISTNAQIQLMAFPVFIEIQENCGELSTEIELMD